MAMASPDFASRSSMDSINAGENGMEHEVNRAAILEVDPVSGSTRPFATGLRNPNGLGWQSGALWTVVNERDELGNDLVPVSGDSSRKRHPLRAQ
jgi:glucose/arabinose dehydrogenase